MADIKLIEQELALPEIKPDFPNSGYKTLEKHRQGADDANSRKKLKLETFSPNNNNDVSSFAADGKMPEFKAEKNITVVAEEEDRKGKGILMDDKRKGKTIQELEDDGYKWGVIEESEDDQDYMSDDSDSEFSDGLDTDLEDYLPFEDDLDKFLKG
ncbi:Uncharacterized protein Adt_25737 [Abeliophyllum distichum]|uniref:Uncharacterized protein n=1 Tax=Abeliophyllum distichum TaxID=126358 RepID=A0ABD1SHI0_9LAMI